MTILVILWDISKFANEKEMKQYIESVGNNVTQDYLLLKLYHYFTYRCTKGSDEEAKYIKLLSKLSTNNTLFPGIASIIKYRQLLEYKKTQNKTN